MNSNPENAATIDEKPVSATVSSIVKEITTDEDGNYVFPENAELTPELQFAATAEKRRRDAQATYTKQQQSIKALEAEKAKLLEQLAGKAQPELTLEQQEELDTLKYEDPDAWRRKMNQIEYEATSRYNESIANLTGEAKAAAEQQFELERRQQVLSEFNDSHEIAITDELIANDVPPRITKKLEDGKISFEDFLEEVATYVAKPKTVQNEKTLKQPNLSNISGGKTPDTSRADANISSSYASTIF